MRQRLLVPLLFGVLGTGMLVGLGVWQVQRMVWKHGVLAEIDARIHEAPAALPEAPEPATDRYRAVSATGVLGGPEIHVLVSTKELGAGYRVIQPFNTDGRRIMADRGFIDLADKDAARPGGTVTLTGNLHWPDEVDSYTPDPDEERGIWFARDVPALAARLGTDPVLLIVRDAAPKRSGDPIPLPLDSATIPDDHLEYAITWFSLAVVWAGMTLYLVRRRMRPEKGDTT
ncbi:SURF1 family protein [Roseovarius spongiae]|uniref:SURF1-like protein n=1 Tax=Roseovarius spongiae TaxID=2320272 RepID=A0A3A8AZF6_9RHOB|nr:SURF1 family protein [Roseovarius spongiae]RKF16370.1 SURF1 family protein [Roseovarius spongiae]